MTVVNATRTSGANYRMWHFPAGNLHFLPRGGGISFERIML